MPLTGPPWGALRILLVEDSPEDAELMSEQMLDAGLEARFERVESEAELRQALAAFQPDIVLSDLSMPGFSGDDALRIVRETSPEIPFIFVSGTMGEENAVAALQKGAMTTSSSTSRRACRRRWHVRSAMHAARSSAHGWKPS